MKLLANENVPLAAVRSLEEAGWDVVSISELSPGIDDRSVLSMARREQRVLLTFDRDYGELVFARGLPSPPGIVYMRFAPKHQQEAADILKRMFAENDSAAVGYFVVLDRDGLRKRPLPGAV